MYISSLLFVFCNYRKGYNRAVFFIKIWNILWCSEHLSYTFPTSSFSNLWSKKLPTKLLSLWGSISRLHRSEPFWHATPHTQYLMFKLQSYYLTISHKQGSILWLLQALKIHIICTYYMPSIYWENDTSLWDDFNMEQLGKCIYNAWKVKQQFRELQLTAESFEEIILIFLE